MSSDSVRRLRDIAMQGRTNVTPSVGPGSEAQKEPLELNASDMVVEDTDARDTMPARNELATSEGSEPIITHDEDHAYESSASAPTLVETEETETETKPMTTASDAPATEETNSRDNSVATRGSPQDLANGQLLPARFLPLSAVSDYEQMNDLLRDGRLKLTQVKNAPHLAITKTAVDDLIDGMREIVRGNAEQAASYDTEIAKAEEEIARLRAARGAASEAHRQASEKVASLQNLRASVA